MFDEEYSSWYHTGTTEEHPSGPEIPEGCREAYWSSPEPTETRRRRGRVIGIIAGVILLIIASAYLFALPGRKTQQPELQVPSLPGFEQEEPSISTKTDTDELPRAETGTGVTMTLDAFPQAEPLSLQEIYRSCQPSVVAIRTTKSKQTGALGTGIIMTADGYVLTNAHVLDGAKKVTITLLADESEYEAKLVGTDSVSDLAVLKIDAQGLSPASFANSEELQVGDPVVAIGNPLGTELNGTMTNGIVSAINRNVIYGGHSMSLIQTNAAINEGNSGGPLINEHGQIIGVTNMKAFDTGVEGICFAIPTSVVRPVVNALIAEGKVSGRPSIGIVIGALDEAAADYYDVPQGLYVESVAEGSDAEAKGIQPGDIVTAVNGQPVADTYSVNAIKEQLSVGDTLTLTIFREGETFDVEVTLMDTNDIY